MSKRVRIPKDGFRIHPAAEIFPLMKEKELGELTASIERHGLREAISVLGDQILDGRNRYRALQKLGQAGQARHYRDVSSQFFFCADMTQTPLDYVIAKNLHRRHLNASQRASVAVAIKQEEAEEAEKRKAATQIKNGQTPVQKNFSGPGKQGQARDIAAKQLNVSGPMVDMAETVAKHGTPELQAAVRDGKVSVSAAAEIAKEEPEVQRQAVAGGKKGVAKAAKHVRQTKSTASFNLSASKAKLEKRIQDIAGMWPKDSYPALARILRELADQIESQCTSNDS